MALPPVPGKPYLVGSVTDTSLTIAWKVESNSRITHYMVFFRTVDEHTDETSGWELFQTPDTSQECKFSSLTPDTGYQFRVASCVGGMQSRPGGISDSIRTSSRGIQSQLLAAPKEELHTFDPPPIPRKPILNGTPGHNRVSLAWDVDGDTSNVTHYTVTYRVVENVFVGSWAKYETKDANKSCIIDKLEPQTSYRFCVSSNTEKGASRPGQVSSVISTTVDRSCISAKLKLTVDGSVTHSSVPLSWELAGHTRIVTNYTVFYRKANDVTRESYQTSGPETKVTISGLEPMTSYQFWVKPNTKFGSWLPSEICEITTREYPHVSSDRLQSTPTSPQRSSDWVQNTPPPPERPSDWVQNTSPPPQRSSDSSQNTPTPTYTNTLTAWQGSNLSCQTRDTYSSRPEGILVMKPELYGQVTQSSITVFWGVSGDTRLVHHYTLSCRRADGAGPLMTYHIDKASTFYRAEGLRAGTPYKFFVTLFTENGQSQVSEESNVFATCNTPDSSEEMLPSAGKPTLAGLVSHNSVPLTWNVIGNTRSIVGYEISYRKCDSQGPLMTVTSPENKHTVEDLDPDTSYTFSVCINYGSSRSLPSELSVIKTSKAHCLLSGQVYSIRMKSHTSTDSSDESRTGGRFTTESRSERRMYHDFLISQSELAKAYKDMPIYQVPLRLTEKNEAQRIQKFEFNTKPAIHKEEKIILVVGATGAGKSTLINGLLNHILGVEWSDKVRFRLVEETGLFEDQHQSQTRPVTVYTLHHHRIFTVPYTVTIIDTPGFGGGDKDKLISESITHLFSKKEYGIDHIECIGFVVQSSLARLTKTQMYMFDSILSLFGNDIAENIFLFITFSDSQRPPVLASIKEAKIPFKSHFKFNNSALFARNDTEDNEFDKMFWKMGAISFNKFLHELERIKGKSLYLTKQMLDERQQLEVYVEGIQKEIRNGLAKLEQYRVELNVVKQHEADIERNKDFVYTVDEIKMKKVDLEPGQNVTNCLTCNRTCHSSCTSANDEEKKLCSVMDENGYCTVCPMNCIWNMHRSVPYRIEIETVTVTKTFEDSKARYEKAKVEKMNAEKLTNEILEDIMNLEVKVTDMADEVRRCLARLSEIALRPNPLSTVEYIERMIHSEEAERKPGFQARIKQLEGVKTQAAILKEMAAEGYDPFKEYRETLKNARDAKDRTSYENIAELARKKNPFLTQKLVKGVKGFLNIK